VKLALAVLVVLVVSGVASAQAPAPEERITGEMWPAVPVVPTMGPGATDGRFLRNAGIPTYGVSGLFVEATDNGRTAGMSASAFGTSSPVESSSSAWCRRSVQGIDALRQ
jgi:hypothetical protein